MKKQVVFLICLWSVTALFSQTGPNYYPSKTDWQHLSPATLEMDTSALNTAVDFALANEYSGPKDLRLAILKGFSREPDHDILGPVKQRGGPAGIILKNGYIVAEWGDTRRVDMTFSVTKSYLSTVAGLAIEDGLIRSVQDTVKEYVWDGTFDGKHNSAITWEHLLHQTSDWSGALFGLYDWADRPDRKGDLDQWRYRKLYPPGSHYKYNDVRVNVLAYSLLQVWRRPLPQVIKERVMDPIGASTTWRWFGYDNTWVNVDGIKMQSVSGGGHHGGGLFINTMDHARLGLLFSRRGKWNNKQLIAKKWIQNVRTPTPANRSYGYMWWLNRKDGERHWEGIPESVYYAAGFGGNFIVIDEEKDLVIVTRWLEPSKIGEMVRLVYGSF